MNVAVDAMGGDHAPDEVVAGAVEAASRDGIPVILVGDRERIARSLGSVSPVDGVTIHHCAESIGMGESPLKAVRKKKDASIRVAFQLVREGRADAVVSAGNSGATLAAGVLTLGCLPGVERPAIAGVFPGKKGPVVLIDVGANVDCRPGLLFQFGMMAHAFVTSFLGIENPRIGLLSIGEESGKGNEQVRLARELFENSRLNFTGNVEGRDIFTGDVEIIVCDGFVGNVALKLGEGLAETMFSLLKSELRRSFLLRIGCRLGRKPLRSLRKKLHYEAYGGAPLLGINGVGIVCHGGSLAPAIRNAVCMARRYASCGLSERMAAQMTALSSSGLKNRD
ncbi:MAG: phosphate acyltransferase PlsX [Deltaproteobacteria bacterium]|nr:MAG: phosphate acyltransferase PlsX [Deltaproteobacteria bacterium]